MKLRSAVLCSSCSILSNVCLCVLITNYLLSPVFWFGVWLGGLGQANISPLLYKTKTLPLNPSFVIDRIINICTTKLASLRSVKLLVWSASVFSFGREYFQFLFGNSIHINREFRISLHSCLSTYGILFLHLFDSDFCCWILLFFCLLFSFFTLSYLCNLFFLKQYLFESSWFDSF